MAFEITVAEALAILQVTRAELKFLVARGDLQQFDVRDRKGKVVRRFLHYEEAVELAKRLERPVPVPRRSDRPRRRRPRDPSLLTATQVARAIGTTPENLHRFVDEGRLTLAEQRGTRRFFRREDVEAFMEQVQRDHGLEHGGLELAPGDELLGAVRAARLLQSTAWKIYAYVRRGALPVARFTVNGMRLFRRSDVLELAGVPSIRARRERKTA